MSSDRPGGTRVCIHGVGRSGTKIVQLATCLGLAREHGRCDVVYEPFHWADRGCSTISEPGVREHRRLPLVLSAADEADEDSPSLRATLASRGGVPMVAKFIRGLGRIGLIDRLASPHCTIVVIRPLIGVLQSLRRCPFDLLGKGQAYPSDAPRLRAEIEASPSLPFSKAFAGRCESPEDTNALWWLAMNEAGIAGVCRLRDAGRSVLLVDHRALVERPSETGRRLSDFLGLPPFDVALERLCDAWIRDETLLRTKVPDTATGRSPGADDHPFRQRVSRVANALPPPRRRVRVAEPAEDLVANPLYRAMDAAVWHLVGGLPS